MIGSERLQIIDQFGFGWTDENKFERMQIDDRYILINQHIIGFEGLQKWSIRFG